MSLSVVCWKTTLELEDHCNPMPDSETGTQVGVGSSGGVETESQGGMKTEDTCSRCAVLLQVFMACHLSLKASDL